MKNRKKFETYWLLTLFSFLLFVAAGDSNQKILQTPEAQKLIQGNERFAANDLQSKNLAAERAELIKGQHPYAIVLTCSDSRVSPELLFDESLGKLFVIRVAGNVIDPIILGSVEYAAEHLGSKFLLVLGHSACGAVKATIAGGEIPPNIQKIADAISPAVTKAKEKHLDGKELENEVITDNVIEQVHQLRTKSSIVAEMEHKGELRIVGGVYDLGTGKVHFFR